MTLTVILAFLALAGDAALCAALWLNASPWMAFWGLAIGPGLFLALFILWLLIITLWGKSLNTKKHVEGYHGLYYWIVVQTDFLVMRLLRVKTILRGGEKLPKEGKIVFVNNHISNFDQMAMLAVCPDPLICISKPENFSFPIAGPMIHHAGFIPINRDNAKEGVKAIYQAVGLLEQETANIEICPEGTRNKTGNPLLPFHPGSFRVATLSKAPLAICCLKNTQFVHKRAPWRKTIVYVDVLEVLYYDDYKDKSTHELAEYASNLILQDLRQRERVLY